MKCLLNAKLVATLMLLPSCSRGKNIPIPEALPADSVESSDLEGTPVLPKDPLASPGEGSGPISPPSAEAPPPDGGTTGQPSPSDPAPASPNIPPIEPPAIVTIIDGNYSLMNVQSNKCLEAVGGIASDSAIQQLPCVTSDRQIFRVKNVANGLITLHNVPESLTLEITNSSKTSGAALVQGAINNAANEQFAVRGAADDQKFIQSEDSKFFLQIAPGALQDGARAVQSSFNVRVNQLWIFLPQN